MAKEHGKKYLAAAAKVDQDRLYTPEEAAQLVKDTSFTNFDGTVEVHLRLGIDPRHADQTVRSTASLPHGTGKKSARAGIRPG
jgi:large subunit ribosomal protein L1